MKKQKKKLREIIIECDVFKTHMMILIGDKNLVFDWVKKNTLDHAFNQFKELWDPEEIKKTTQGYQVPLGGGGSIIWLEKFNLNVLIHELDHAKNHMLMEKGIHLCNETDEVYAYVSEYLFRKVNSI